MYGISQIENGWLCVRARVTRICETEKRARLCVTSSHDSRVMSHFLRVLIQESKICFTMADATIFDSSSTSTPRLHILHLPAAINEDEAEKRSFRASWFIDDENCQATRPIPREQQEQKHADDETLSWQGLQTHDLIYFPDQITGAGEFEGCRSVGERTDQGFLLLSAGIESPIFPSQLVASIGDVSNLRVSTKNYSTLLLRNSTYR